MKAINTTTTEDEENFRSDPERFRVDSRISYPSYKSLDEFIDVERLRSLDDYIADGIRRHIETRKQEDYFINYYRLDESMPYQPGVREIWLSRTKAGTPYDYLDLNRTDLWEPTEDTAEFALLMDFIENLPFKRKGRMLIIYDDAGRSVPAHRDHIETDVCHEFVWFRTNLKKPFYVLNHETNEKKYVTSYSAWFDSVNQFHGSDAAPSAEGLSFSLRVDGAFSDEFKKLIPRPEFNLASMPSFWACGVREKFMTERKTKMNVAAAETSGKTESGNFDDLPDDTPVDSRISYPSYKSFDEIIDVERLRSLDGYLTQKIKRRLAVQEDLKFYTGPYKLDGNVADRPGSRMIYLAYSEQPDSYFDLDRCELWHPTVHAAEFSLLMDFIKTLPFQTTGRMLIMYDDVARQVPAHRDHIETELCHEFLWFRTNAKKPFFMLNQKTGEKKYVAGHSAWFDSVNQFHGSDACDGLSFSIRVDGKFTDEFRDSIPKPEFNLASTPSYWAAVEKKG